MTLSGGEQQMLAVARALARDVKLLLLDEPYEGLAPVIVRDIEKILEEIKALGFTTIIVEQNAIAALHLSDRAIILDMGEIVFDGTGPGRHRQRRVAAAVPGDLSCCVAVSTRRCGAIEGVEFGGRAMRRVRNGNNLALDRGLLSGRRAPTIERLAATIDRALEDMR